MAQQNKNKYTRYILVSLAYILAVIFILQDQETNVIDRITIVYFYLVSILGVFAYEYLKKMINNMEKKFTPIEIQIINLIAQEYSAKIISQKLKLTEKTVINYKERLRKKTGSYNSVGIVIYAIKNKLIEI